VPPTAKLVVVVVVYNVAVRARAHTRGRRRCCSLFSSFKRARMVV